MTRTYIKCDLCGDMWDVTDTKLSKFTNPGFFYHNNKVREGVRRFRIVKERAVADDHIMGDDLDLCDKCYNAIERFIFSLSEEGEDGSKSTL